jgi:hypothetical protein
MPTIPPDLLELVADILLPEDTLQYRLSPGDHRPPRDFSVEAEAFLSWRARRRNGAIFACRNGSVTQ